MTSKNKKNTLSNSKKAFVLYSNYYDLLYKTKDYEAESKYIHNLMKQFNLNGKKLLELGSGTGKHANILTKYGYEIVGIERSKEMARLAKQNNKFQCLVGDITQMQLNKKFHAAFSLFHVVSYLNTNESIQELFSNTNKHLVKNGLFIFDVWYSPAVLFNQPEVRIKRMSNEDTEVIRFAEPEAHENLNLVNVKYTIFQLDKKGNNISQIQESHSMRHFSIPELTYFAQQNGFVVEHTEEFLTSKLPSKNTWGVLFVLRKLR